MMSSGINLVMTVIGFGMSILFIVFVCTRLICARIYLSVSRRSSARASRSDLGILERGIHGLEPLALADFPTKKYRELCLSSKENAQSLASNKVFPQMGLMSYEGQNDYIPIMREKVLLLQVNIMLIVEFKVKHHGTCGIQERGIFISVSILATDGSARFLSYFLDPKFLRYNFLGGHLSCSCCFSWLARE
ncbi:UNVERIFIED_CONTAM: hypothetical protein Slati_4188100 [Sesamum latifolium]|uniref:Uncharacterized protein n=1 Tax=Sesamum latifolium TaxID=2727402 RepID=A0AAW2TAG8_9LAMI